MQLWKENFDVCLLFSYIFLFSVVHEGEKKHVCHCGKTFSDAGYLKRHQRAGMVHL